MKWGPGQSGNPAGRPLGARSRLPTMRALVNAVIAENVDGIRGALAAVLTDPGTVLHGLDLAARLNRELGPPRLLLGEEGTEAGGLTVIMKQYVVNSATAPASAAPPSRSRKIESLPVRSDRPMETATPPGPDDGSEVPAPTPTPGSVDEAPPGDTVRITLKHFVDPEPR
jgi:hypothetical protein